MNKETGGPAFPNIEYKQPVGGGSHMMTIIGGMTLRDYFAAKALQGICASGPSASWPNDHLAAKAYNLADAMLKARDQ
jgi:hypothetical protein